MCMEGLRRTTEDVIIDLREAGTTVTNSDRNRDECLWKRMTPKFQMGEIRQVLKAERGKQAREAFTEE